MSMGMPPLYKDIPPAALWLQVAEPRLQAFKDEALENPDKLRELFMSCWYEGYVMAVCILQMKNIDSDRPEFVEKMRECFLIILGEYLQLVDEEQ